MTSGEILIFGKAALTFALPLGLAVVSLVRLRREIRADRARAARSGDADALRPERGNAPRPSTPRSR